ncbi:MAG: nuclear transport factor 2 family protein [Gammaproteobacteria bacterium]|jgi:hypothetical protein
MSYFTHSAEEAESAFYAAFEHLDIELMRAIWMKTDDIFCIHPGGPIQTGYETVLKQWSFILNDHQSPEINYKVISTLQSEDSSIHLVEETIGSDENQVKILASNTYFKTEQGWRLFSHHASLPPSPKKSESKNQVIH